MAIKNIVFVCYCLLLFEISTNKSRENKQKPEINNFKKLAEISFEILNIN